MNDKSKEEGADKGENRIKIQTELGSVAVGKDGASAATPTSPGHRDTLGKATSHHPSHLCRVWGAGSPPAPSQHPASPTPRQTAGSHGLGRRGTPGDPQNTHTYTHTHPCAKPESHHAPQKGGTASSTPQHLQASALCSLLPTGLGL